MGEVDPGVNDGDLDASAIDSPVPCLLNTQQIITEPAFVVGLAGLGNAVGFVVWMLWALLTAWIPRKEE